jgi:prophage maintenance system killer protein
MHPISEALCETYAELYRRGQVSFPLHDKQRRALDSIVKTVEAEYFGTARHATHIDKAVAYLCLIIKDHPVTDGNKRLALLWFRVYCILFQLDADPTPYSYDEIAVAIEKNKDVPLDRLIHLVTSLLFAKATN